MNFINNIIYVKLLHCRTMVLILMILSIRSRLSAASVAAGTAGTLGVQLVSNLLWFSSYQTFFFPFPPLLFIFSNIAITAVAQDLDPPGTEPILQKGQ